MRGRVREGRTRRRTEDGEITYEDGDEDEDG
jgi:hypothetical protein